MAAPDEPDGAVTGGDTPSGGTLRRLLSRDGNPLFGAHTNGSLAPPLSVPVDPLLAGPPMDTAVFERESGKGSGKSSGAGSRGNGHRGKGAVAPTTVEAEAVGAEAVGTEAVDADALGTAALDVEAVDAESGAGIVDAEEFLAADDAVAEDLLSEDLVAEDLVAEDLVSEDLVGDNPVVEARTTPSPLTDPAGFVDPPATVAVPALIPAPTETGLPTVDPSTVDASTELPTERVAVPPPPRRRRTRPRVRKVTRIVRYIDAWSVFKVALLLNVVVAAVMATASVLLWNLAYSTDVIDNIEGVIEDWLAYETFTFDGESMFRAVLVLSGLFVIGATGLAVLAATLFNLISDLTGGVRVTVLEREVLASTPPRARKLRGGAARRAAARHAAADQASTGAIASYPGPDGSV